MIMTNSLMVSDLCPHIPTPISDRSQASISPASSVAVSEVSWAETVQSFDPTISVIECRTPPPVSVVAKPASAKKLTSGSPKRK